MKAGLYRSRSCFGGDWHPLRHGELYEFAHIVKMLQAITAVQQVAYLRVRQQLADQIAEFALEFGLG